MKIINKYLFPIYLIFTYPWSRITPYITSYTSPVSRPKDPHLLKIWLVEEIEECFNKAKYEKRTFMEGLDVICLMFFICKGNTKICLSADRWSKLVDILHFTIKFANENQWSSFLLRLKWSASQRRRKRWPVKVDFRSNSIYVHDDLEQSGGLVYPDLDYISISHLNINN